MGLWTVASVVVALLCPAAVHAAFGPPPAAAPAAASGAAMTSAATPAGSAASAAATSTAGYSVGVWALSNQFTNTITGWRLNADGSLTNMYTVPTGGLGDPSQALEDTGALVFDRWGGREYLFAVNSQSNTISILSIAQPDLALTLVAQQQLRGRVPTSVAHNNGRVCAITAAGTGSLECFTLNANGTLGGGAPSFLDLQAANQIVNATVLANYARNNGLTAQQLAALVAPSSNNATFAALRATPVTSDNATDLAAEYTIEGRGGSLANSADFSNLESPGHVSFTPDNTSVLITIKSRGAYVVAFPLNATAPAATFSVTPESAGHLPYGLYTRVNPADPTVTDVFVIEATSPPCNGSFANGNLTCGGNVATYHYSGPGKPLKFMNRFPVGANDACWVWYYNEHLYTVNFGQDNIAVFTVSANTTLTRLANVPTGTPNQLTRSFPADLAITAAPGTSDYYLFTISAGINELSQYRIDPTADGRLVQMPPTYLPKSFVDLPLGHISGDPLGLAVSSPPNWPYPVNAPSMYFGSAAGGGGAVSTASASG